MARYAFFDVEYYLLNNPDVAVSWPGAPEDHYFLFGAAEGRAPTPWFDAQYYRATNPDLVGLSAADLFAHYNQYGAFEGRAPAAAFAHFDEARYLADYPDLGANGVTANTALAHFLIYGQNEGRSAFVEGTDDPINGGNNVGTTFALTSGLDNIVGTVSNDTINASPEISALGTAITTLNAGDVIDGGDGKDTLNINVGDSGSSPVPTASSSKVIRGDFANVLQQGTIKNVEIININNNLSGWAFSDQNGNVDASKFVGATEIWQNNNATSVVELAETTTAGFRTFGFSGAVSVEAANTAAKATVAGDNIQEGSRIYIGAKADAGLLNSVTLSATVADTNADGVVGPIEVNVMVGKDVQALALNTSASINLYVDQNGKAITAIDASASTGSIDLVDDKDPNSPSVYYSPLELATIKTGSGNDLVANVFAGTATANAATISTGAGDDTLAVDVTKGTATAVTASVDAGDGNDTVNLTIESGVNYTVTAGAGNDTVALSGAAVKTTDKIDGGDGVDAVSIAPSSNTLIADDYIVFNSVLTNFETLKLTAAVSNFDGSQLAANYTTIDLANDSVADNVRAAQALVANGKLLAEAAGYVAATKTAPTTYAGTLNITEKASGLVTANAETVNLNVQGGKADDPTAVDATLTGDVKVATVTLAPGVDTQGTAATTDDTFVQSSVSVDNGSALNAMTSLNLSGNGLAFVHNADTTKLVSVDASALNSVDAAGEATTGLVYNSGNSLAETIKLGGGIDHLMLGSSLFAAMDTVVGLNLVVSAGVLTAASDTIDIIGLNDLTAAGKMVTAQTDLSLALKDAAVFKSGGVDIDTVVFQMGGNTYVYQDTVSPAGSNLVSDDDIVVKLAGNIDLDALVVALNGPLLPA